MKHYVPVSFADAMELLVKGEGENLFIEYEASLERADALKLPLRELASRNYYHKKDFAGVAVSIKDDREERTELLKKNIDQQLKK
nr:MAG TPA_asm: hypothetical protein [Caudoviricetes sp.]